LVGSCSCKEHRTDMKFCTLAEPSQSKKAI
jgi:hypothetical protein